MMQEGGKVERGREGGLWGDVCNFGLRLLVVCAVAAAGLGLTYGAVKSNIERMEQEEKEEGARKVLEAAGLEASEDPELLEAVKGGSESLEENVISVFRGEGASGSTDGYAFVLKAKGYNFMTMAVGVDGRGKVIAVTVVKQEETPGIGSAPTASADYLAGYEGRGPGPLRLGGEVDAWTGATFTSNGILNGVNLALEAFETIDEGKQRR